MSGNQDTKEFASVDLECAKIALDYLYGLRSRKWDTGGYVVGIIMCLGTILDILWRFDEISNKMYVLIGILLALSTVFFVLFKVHRREGHRIWDVIRELENLVREKHGLCYLRGTGAFYREKKNERSNRD